MDEHEDSEDHSDFAESLFRPDPAAGADPARAVRWLSPAGPGTSLAGLARHGAVRWAVSAPRRHGAVHSRDVSLRSGPRAAVRRALAAGVVAGPRGSALPGPGSLLHRIAADSGTMLDPGVRLGSGGSVLLMATRAGQPAVLRVSPAALSTRHERDLATLRHLQAHGVAPVPRLLAEGATGTTRWSVESRLPGRRPARLTEVLGRSVVDFLVALPPAAEGDHRDPRAFPGLSGDVTERLQAAWAHGADLWTAAAPRASHGDLWTGNLLQVGGQLSGVVDWDAYSRGDVPGVDVVHLVATDERLRSRRPMGAELLSRPWTREPLRELWSRYVDAVGLDADVGRLESVVVAWWLRQVSATLARAPQLARDQRWLEDNVLAVLRESDSLRS